MHFRLHTLVAVLAAGTLSVACADATSPTTARDVEPLLAKGAGGGGGGGGGGGATVGKIRRASAAATCDAGSSIGIQVSKGFADRADVFMSMVASPTPTGPAIPPSAFPQTSLGGAWEFLITEPSTGFQLMRFSTTMGLVISSVQLTNLTRTVTPGVHTFSFVAINHQSDGVIDYATLMALPAHETCTATITVLAE